MSRRFHDAADLLGDLLDRHEAGAASPIAYPDYSAFSSVTATDAFIRDLKLAAEAGAVRLTHGKGRSSDQLAHIRLESPEALYRYLHRTPSSDVAQRARAQIVEGLQLNDDLVKVSGDIASLWARGKSWSGFLPADAGSVRRALALAQAVLDGSHVGLDYRTFSRRTTGDSKTLERLEGAVVRLLAGIRDVPPGARPREVLRTLGLEKFAPPLLIAGPVDVGDSNLASTPLSYFGVPTGAASAVRFRQEPKYLLTIENYASFNRHVLEADPQQTGVTVYVGGYPSLGTQDALRILAAKLHGDTPIYHWSDIDPDGTWIFRTIERAIGRPVRAHLMSPQIAEKHGKRSDNKLSPRECPSSSGIADLVAYLSRDGAKTLEQEELDPSIPNG